MARSMWTGVISFGLVTIPVALYTATQSHNVTFHLLHEKCDTRIKEQRWCPHCDKQVDWDEIVKGFEYAKGKYIEITDEDFEKLPLPSKHTIDLSAFVDESQIDPIFYDSTYYVAVDEGPAQKAYKLLVHVMETNKVAAIASITLRNKERMCAIRTMDGRLCLQTLLYQDEIKENASSKPDSVKISAQEKKLAEHLVEALTDQFDPRKFKDTYQAALKKLIQAKLKGKLIKEPAPKEPTASGDLMDMLRASVENAKAAGSSHKRASTSAAKKSPKRSRRNKAA